MQIVLTSDDLRKLSEAARAEILALVLGRDAGEASPVADADAYGPDYAGIDMSGVVDLSFRETQKWMAAASDRTKAGLYVFAAQGGVLTAKDLTRAGITNLPHFQSRTTIRTRTIKKDRDAYLLGWDDWSRVEDGDGRYAVTPKTYRSLRRYFGLG
jgi:hypothetical protein